MYSSIQPALSAPGKMLLLHAPDACTVGTWRVPCVGFAQRYPVDFPSEGEMSDDDMDAVAGGGAIGAQADSDDDDDDDDTSDDD